MLMEFPSFLPRFWITNRGFVVLFVQSCSPYSSTARSTPGTSSWSPCSLSAASSASPATPPPLSMCTCDSSSPSLILHSEVSVAYLCKLFVVYIVLEQLDLDHLAEPSHLYVIFKDRDIFVVRDSMLKLSVFCEKSMFQFPDIKKL